MKEHLPFAAFMASAALLATGYGVVAERYKLFPAPQIMGGIETGQELAANWRNDFGIEPTRHLVEARRTGRAGPDDARVDHQAGGEPLLPADGARCWSVLKAQALGDGILDAALSLVMESRRTEEQQSEFWQARWISAIHRGVDDMAEDIQADEASFDLGRISYACALGYLDFRLPDLNWRAPHPDLVEWFSEISRRVSFVLTVPPA